MAAVLKTADRRKAVRGFESLHFLEEMMPTRKIADEKEEHKPCFHPDHNVPSHQVFKPGTYEHECAGCGQKKVFVVRGIYCDAKGEYLGPGGDGDVRGRREW